MKDKGPAKKKKANESKPTKSDLPGRARPEPDLASQRILRFTKSVLAAGVVYSAVSLLCPYVALDLAHPNWLFLCAILLALFGCRIVIRFSAFLRQGPRLTLVSKWLRRFCYLLAIAFSLLALINLFTPIKYLILHL